MKPHVAGTALFPHQEIIDLAVLAPEILDYVANTYKVSIPTNTLKSSAAAESASSVSECGRGGGASAFSGMCLVGIAAGGGMSAGTAWAVWGAASGAGLGSSPALCCLKMPPKVVQFPGSASSGAQGECGSRIIFPGPKCFIFSQSSGAFSWILFLMLS